MPTQQLTKHYYGWNITWALAITQTVGYGILIYAFSVFIKPMEAELGWSRAQSSGAFSLALLVSGLLAIPLGRWVDKYGARLLMTLGSTLGVVLMLAWSFNDSLLGLDLIQAGIGFVMASTFYEIAFTVITVWFRRNRRNAMLIVTFMGGLASTIFIPLATFLVETLDWRDALRILAFILAVTTIPLHAFVLRKHPNKLGLAPDGDLANAESTQTETNFTLPEALRTASFWWMSFAFSLDRMTVITIAAHSVPMLLERGYSPAVVAAATGSIGIMQLLGRVLFTPTMGRFSLTMLTSITFISHCLGMLSLLFIPGVASIWCFAVFHGLANGAATLARAALVAETYGSANFGSINGSMVTMIQFAQTIAPFGAGLLHDYSGNYTLVLWILAIISAIAAVAVNFAKPQVQITQMTK